jgi:1-acyl-sn-glycerol-3-phosphate acyltransferase
MRPGRTGTPWPLSARANASASTRRAPSPKTLAYGGKTGAARVALQTGCTVIPIAQWGPQEILAPYSRRLRLLPPKTVHVLAGPPVDLADLRGQPVTPEVLRTASDLIVDAITAQLAKLRGELPPATRFDPNRAGQ